MTVCGDVAQIALAQFQADPPFDAFQIEQVFDQGFNAVYAQQAKFQGFFLQRGEIIGFLAQQIQRPHRQVDGIAQVVGRRQDHVAFHALDFFEARDVLHHGHPAGQARGRIDDG